MSTLAANNLTISDVVRRSKPDGTVGIIGELLDQTNTIVKDAPWVEGELPSGHMSTHRTSLPTFATRNPNGSTTPSKSTTSQTLEAAEFIEAFSEVDEIVARYGGNIESKRASEAVAFSESAVQTVSSRILNGNGTTTVGQINGIATRYALTTAANGSNIVLGGGSAGTDQMSMYLLEWGVGKVYCWYPKGTAGGLEINDFGKRVVEDSTARKVMYTEQWLWGFGLAIDDWRYAVRIPNIDKSLLLAGTGADLNDLMSRAVHCLPKGGDSGRRAWYCNRTTRMMLDIQSRDDVKAGGGLSYANVGGQMIETFRGIALNVCDQLTEAESVIS
jgi:hypothetical protein